MLIDIGVNLVLGQALYSKYEFDEIDKYESSCSRIFIYVKWK
jgi:hypothetical protein